MNTSYRHMLHALIEPYESLETFRNIRKVFYHYPISQQLHAIMTELLSQQEAEEQQEEESFDLGPIPDALITRYHEQVAAAKKPKPYVHPERILFGSIWTVQAPDFLDNESEKVHFPYVVLLKNAYIEDEDAVVPIIPATEWTGFKTEDDLVIPENSLHPELMLECWNKQPMFVRQLYRCVSAVNTTEMDWITEMIGEILGVIKQAKVPAHRRGKPITQKNDPRILFQEAELLRTFPLRLPVIREMGGLVSGTEITQETEPPQAIPLRLPVIREIEEEEEDKAEAIILAFEPIYQEEERQKELELAADDENDADTSTIPVRRISDKEIVAQAYPIRKLKCWGLGDDDKIDSKKFFIVIIDPSDNSFKSIEKGSIKKGVKLYPDNQKLLEENNLLFFIEEE